MFNSPLWQSIINSTAHQARPITENLRGSAVPDGARGFDQGGNGGFVPKGRRGVIGSSLPTSLRPFVLLPTAPSSCRTTSYVLRRSIHLDFSYFPAPAAPFSLPHTCASYLQICVSSPPRSSGVLFWDQQQLSDSKRSDSSTGS
jgi:hypothetical protein